MSLFKVRDFWTFDLAGLQLEAHSSVGRDSFSDLDDDSQEGTFTASIGRFKAIGEYDVFVCGNLQGSIFIVQVPIADQRKYIKVPSSRGGTDTSPVDGSESEQSYDSTYDRQLLAATSLGMPIIDLKCGYFNSALKQSIAVLSFDKLLLLQVKRHEAVDLITEPELDSRSPNGSNIISPNQLSHEFEQLLHLDLLANEFACSLVVLNSHADSSLNDSSNRDTAKDDSLDLSTKRKLKKETNNFIKQSKLIVQQLHLPQRDKLIVQYVNQFLFSLVDGKKITGHFSVTLPSDQVDIPGGSDPKAQQVIRSLGNMPMAYLHCNKGSSSVVLSFSDYRIFCVPLDKLVSHARHDVMKRVASNLLHNGDPSAEVSPIGKVSSLAFGRGRTGEQRTGTISLDIDSMAEWSYEMLAMPLQMSSEHRRAKNLTASGHKNEVNVSQLLVMSRYSFEMFSACGQHLWSHRFETPLIRSFTYVLEPDDNDNQGDVITIDGGRLKVQFCDKLISLLCTDSLSAGKSNLLVLEENRIQWSALLSAKPLKIWRLDLTHMPGLLAILDIKQGQLCVSYLGTNSDERDEDIDDLESDNVPAGDITKLETIDEPFLGDDATGSETSTKQSLQSEQRRRLTFEVGLEASGVWPNVVVDLLAEIRMDPQSTSVIHNIVATFEYDDLVRFDMSPSEDQSITMLSYPSSGVAQLKLGNCWPDRKEPIYLRGSFSHMLAHKISFGVTAMDELESNVEGLKASANSGLLPKSLKVRVVLSYNETHSSTLVQDESFLLPISMISQLTHIDYTNGSGQNIDDVLNNLIDYNKGPTTKSQPYQFCDLFLQLDLDMIEFLNEFVERDLVCRRTSSIQEKHQQERSKFEHQVETLENINLLAQSLDCRLRYKSPTWIARQSSEEMIVPAMTSFGIRIDQSPTLDILNIPDRDRVISSNVIWIHICDMNSTNSSLVEEFVMRHAKDWMHYAKNDTEPEVAIKRPEKGINNLLVSIECETSWPLMLVLDHMSARATSVTGSTTHTGATLIKINSHKDYESVLEAIRYGHHLAISTSLHHSLRSILDSYETRHRDRLKELRDKLAREECKFYIATRAILSLSKRLPSLPEDMGAQLMNLSALVKSCQQSIGRALNELYLLRDADLQLSKIPYVPSIRLMRTSKSEAADVWPDVDRLID